MRRSIDQLLPGIPDDPSVYAAWIELKAHSATVSSGVAPSDVGQETAAILPLNSERLLAAQIAGEPEAASLFRGILHQHVVGENRTVLVPLTVTGIRRLILLVLRQ